MSCVQSGETLTITANASNSPLAFSITLAPDGANPAVIVSSQVTYQGPATNPATLFFRALLPNVQNFQLPNTPTLPGTTAMAMVPQTIGTLLPLSQVTASLGASYGSLAADPTIGLPTSLNVMEIAEVYDGSAASGGGLFFIDLDGDYGNNIPPLQFNVTNTGSGYQIAGSWTVLLKLNQTVTLPRLAIGVHASGDWSNAVNYYVSKRSPAWTYPDTPEWFREAGGILLAWRRWWRLVLRSIQSAGRLSCCAAHRHQFWNSMVCLQNQNLRWHQNRHADGEQTQSAGTALFAGCLLRRSITRLLCGLSDELVGPPFELQIQ